MLLGRYRGRIIAQGRIAFPAKLRAALGDKIVITQGYEKSLIAVSQARWQKLIAKTGSKPFIFGAARDTARFLLGSAQLIRLDKQGRFVLPGYLREYALLGEEAIFLGLGDYVEIWDSKRWEQYQQRLEVNIEAIAERLSSINTGGE